MDKLKGLKCRECGRSYPASPLHVCEFCFGPLEVDYRYEALKGFVTIRPSLSVFDRALARLTSQAAQEEP